MVEAGIENSIGSPSTVRTDMTVYTENRFRPSSRRLLRAPKLLVLRICVLVLNAEGDAESDAPPDEPTFAHSTLVPSPTTDWSVCDSQTLKRACAMRHS